jgi:hypothetical protein
MLYTFLYLDPSSGSYIIQMIVAAVLGSMFFFKNAWLKLKYFLFPQKKQQDQEKENDL